MQRLGLDAAADRALEADERRVLERRRRLDDLVERQVARLGRAARERQPHIGGELVDRRELAQPRVPRGAVGAEHAGAIEVDVARRRPRDAADRCGQHLDDVEQRRQPVRQVGRANQQGARALAVPLVHQPELALAERDERRAADRAAVAASLAAGNVRSRSYSPYAAIRQSRHPARTSASADASRCAGVGAGVTATAGCVAREQADAARTSANSRRHHASSD